jgi:hypothetical protein
MRIRTSKAHDNNSWALNPCPDRPDRQEYPVDSGHGALAANIPIEDDVLCLSTSRCISRIRVYICRSMHCTDPFSQPVNQIEIWKKLWDHSAVYDSKTAKLVQRVSSKTSFLYQQASLIHHVRPSKYHHHERDERCDGVDQQDLVRRANTAASEHSPKPPRGWIYRKVTAVLMLFSADQ